MCGIFGAIGTNIDMGKIRALAVANRERGDESLGFFDSSAKFVKRGMDPYKALADSRVANYLAHPKRWFLAGHTRQSTRGKVSDQNSHPFRYGNIIGAHNGIVYAPTEYAVDSEYLIDSLNKRGPDPQAALEGISGYWALSYFDGDAFYLTTHRNAFWLGRDRSSDGNTWYYSSEAKHLTACTGITEIAQISDGEGMKFIAGKNEPIMLPRFTGKGAWVEYDARTGGNSYYEKGGCAISSNDLVWSAAANKAKKTKRGKKSKWPTETRNSGKLGFLDSPDREELIEYSKAAQALGCRGLTDFCDQYGCINYYDAMDMIDGMLRTAERDERDYNEYREAFADYASDDIPF